VTASAGCATSTGAAMGSHCAALWADGDASARGSVTHTGSIVLKRATAHTSGVILQCAAASPIHLRMLLEATAANSSVAIRSARAAFHSLMGDSLAVGTPDTARRFP
jgi:hypothetical protein